MPRKTVLIQACKLAPKSNELVTAIAADNKDSIIGDRLEQAKDEKESLTMGNLLKDNGQNQNKEDKTEDKNTEGSEE
jgi:recombinational DNA repair protein RecT